MAGQLLTAGMTSSGISPPTTKSEYTPGLESGRKRRAEAMKILEQLQILRLNEETCMSNIPENLCVSDAYLSAEHAESYLQEAIDMLEVAYCIEYKWHQ
jgi:hypothetical protein